MLSTSQKTRDPRPALALTYAADFGHLGIVMPFLAPWLHDRGMGAAAIGFLLALPPLFKIVAPWTWGRWADRSGRRRGLLLAGVAVSAAAMATLVGVRGFVPLALVIGIYGFARSPVLPYVEATALEQSERFGFAYGPIRLWGSLAFIAASSGFGAAASRLSLDAGLLLAAGLLGICAAAVVALPAPLPAPSRGDARSGPERTGAPADRAGLVPFFAACALMQASHGAYYSFYSIRLEELGYGEAAIGLLWALAVLCEVLILAKTDRIVGRFGHDRVLRACLVVAAVRWMTIGSTESPALIVLAQVMHAATYAAFHVAAIRVVYERFGHRARAEGQAMYSGMAFGAGLFAGSLAAGWLADAVGLAAAFRVSAGVALAALVVLGRGTAVRRSPAA